MEKDWSLYSKLLKNPNMYHAFVVDNLFKYMESIIFTDQFKVWLISTSEQNTEFKLYVNLTQVSTSWLTKSLQFASLQEEAI